jgi:Fe-S-cluster containining protein
MSEEKKEGCTRCGMCCMTADVSWRDITKENESAVLDQLKWLNLHRCDTMIVKHEDKRQAVLRVPIICRMLDQNKDGKYFCKDYDNRPQVCRMFTCARAKQGIPVDKQA